MLRNFVRIFRRSPLVTAAAVAVLALGSGLSLSLFSVLMRLLSPVPPGVEKTRFITVGISQDSGPMVGLRWLDFTQLRAANEGIQTAASSGPLDVVAQVQNSQLILKAEIISADYFRVLGVPVSAGRTIQDTDGAATGAHLAVIRQDLARKWFGTPSQSLGKTVLLADEPFTIVGVVSPPFAGVFAQDTSVWVPPSAVIPVFVHLPKRSSDPSLALLQSPEVSVRANVFYAIAREQGSAYEERLRGQLELIERQMPGARLRLVKGLDIDPGHLASMTAWTKLAAPLALSLFLMAALNFGSFEVAQMAQRRSEIKLRQALGASPRSLLAESMRGPSQLLALAAAIGLGLDFLFQRLFRQMPWLSGANIDWQASIRWADITMVLILTSAGLLIVGGLPVLELRAREQSAWRMGTQVTSDKRTRALLVCVLLVQGAISLVSVLIAVLLVKTMERQKTFDPGFQANGVVIAVLGGKPNEPLILSTDSSSEFPLAVHTRRALQQLNAFTSGEGSAAAKVVPFSGSLPRIEISMEDGRRMAVSYDAVSANYFQALGIGMLQGKTFSGDSFTGTPTEVIVSAALARALWNNKSAVGKVLRVPGAPQSAPEEGSAIEAAPVRVVGVVADAQYYGLAPEPLPLLYLPLQGLYMDQPPTFVIRAAVTPDAAARSLHNIFGNSIPGMDVIRSYSMKASYDQQLEPGKVRAAIAAASGLVLLILALIGAYGVAGFYIAMRERECAIRICLGAQYRSIVWLVLREVMLVTLADIPLAAIAIQTIWNSLLIVYVPGMRTGSHFTWMQGTAIWLLAMLAAVIVPALRLARLQPANLMKPE